MRSNKGRIENNIKHSLGVKCGRCQVHRAHSASIRVESRLHASFRRKENKPNTLSLKAEVERGALPSCQVAAASGLVASACRCKVFELGIIFLLIGDSRECEAETRKSEDAQGWPILRSARRTTRAGIDPRRSRLGPVFR
jgi:hypothetical protein